MLRLLRRDPDRGQPTLEEFLQGYQEADTGRLRQALELILSGHERVQVELVTCFDQGSPVRQRCTLVPGTSILGKVGSIVGILQELDGPQALPLDTREQDHGVAGDTSTGANWLQFRIAVPKGTCEYISPSVLELTGIPPNDWYRRPTLLRDLLFPAWQTRFERTYRRLLSGEGRHSHTFPLLHKRGGIRWFNLQIHGRHDQTGQLVALEGRALDITERKQLERKRRQMMRTLHRTLDAMRSPDQLIPICSHCKKVRDNRGFWKKIEQLLADRGDLLFSHSLCPECLIVHYPEYPQQPPSPENDPPGSITP